MVGASGIFMMAAGTSGSQQINKTRIIEAVIIAAIISAAGYFIALPVLQEKTSQIQNAITEIKQDIKEMKQDLTKVQIEQAKSNVPVQPARRERY